MGDGWYGVLSLDETDEKRLVLRMFKDVEETIKYRPEQL